MNDFIKVNRNQQNLMISLINTEVNSNVKLIHKFQLSKLNLIFILHKSKKVTDVSQDVYSECHVHHVPHSNSLVLVHSMLIGKVVLIEISELVLLLNKLALSITKLILMKLAKKQFTILMNLN